MSLDLGENYDLSMWHLLSGLPLVGQQVANMCFGTAWEDHAEKPNDGV